VPCRGGVPPLKGEELLAFSTQLPEWKVVGEHHIEKSFLFPDFRKALDFVNLVGEVAEEQGHHPDLALTWGEVGVKIYTHKIRGLTESDFILGAKVDRLYFHREVLSESEPQSPIYGEAGDTER
jgi:4a-hydroxytetrahydrobiopterin dehydratase